jgi:hypothetical protein
MIVTDRILPLQGRGFCTTRAVHLAPAPTGQLQEPRQSTQAKWNTPETWASVATMFVLVPVTTRASGAAVHAGASTWAVAAGATVIAPAAAFLLDSGTGKARDRVLFGLSLTFALAAIDVAAKALDVWKVWVMVAVVVPITTVQWLYGRHRRRAGG